MRKYYVFIIKSDFRKIYKNHSETLFKTLENLYNSTIDNFSYSLSIYEQLCLTFDTKVLNKYFQEKFNSFNGRQHIIPRENVIVEVNCSCIIIKTKYNMPSIFKYLLYYNRCLFVCDFQNQDYFWLEKEYSSNS